MSIKTLQYNIKFETIPNIHRFLNVIEDKMSEWYSAPNVFSYPPNVQSVDAPRIVLYSKNEAKSQVIFSQLSASIIEQDVENGKYEVLEKKIKKLHELLKEMNIKDYLFLGLSATVEKRDEVENAAKWVCDKVGKEYEDDVYESAFALVRKREKQFFINEKISSQKDIPNSLGLVSDNFITFTNKKDIKDFILYEIDINDRLNYIETAEKTSMDDAESRYEIISQILDEKLKDWSL